MTGHHLIRVFQFPNRMEGDGYALPPNWKPFEAKVISRGAYVQVICRKWVRDDA